MSADASDADSGEKFVTVDQLVQALAGAGGLANANSNTNNFGGLTSALIAILAVVAMGVSIAMTSHAAGELQARDRSDAIYRQMVDERFAAMKREHDRDMAAVVASTQAAMLVRNDVTILRNELLAHPGVPVTKVFAWLPDRPPAPPKKE
jgi:hypothetical protein